LKRRTLPNPAANELIDAGALPMAEVALAAARRGERDLRHWQRPSVDQFVRRGEALRLCDRNRRRAEVLPEQPPHLPLAKPQPVAEGIDPVLDPKAIVESARVDQRERTADARRAAGPRRAAGGGVGTAPLARAIPRRDRFRRGPHESHVRRQRRPRRTHRAAEDAGGSHAHEELPVGGGIADLHRGVAADGIEGGGYRHGAGVSWASREVWRFSDVSSA
jgi:hypothetical protein